MSIFPLALAATVFGVLPLVAQERPAISARVEGIVYDSTALRALAGARVQLVDAREPSRARTVEADAAGRFAFDTVASGEYLLGFLHARADSLGLALPTVGVTLREAGALTAVLAIPSVRTLIARACRRDFVRDSIGLVLGTARDAGDGAPRRGARVLARWRHFELRGGKLELVPDSAVATSRDDGRWALCGIPAEITAVVVASAGGDSSGTFEVAIPAHGLAVRDVLVGAGDGSVRGRITREDGVGIAGAIARSPRGERQVRTDGEGRFTLESVPAGTQTIDLRAIGFVPQRVPVDVMAGEVTIPPVALLATGTLIDTVKVYGLPDDPWLERSGFFDRRRRAAGGHFLDETQLERKNPLWVVDLLVQIPGVFVSPAPTGSGYIVQMRGGPALSTGFCTPELWIDGMRLSFVGDWRSIVSGYDIKAMEVYTRHAQMPSEFYNFKGCGAVVIWTGVRKPVAR